LPATPARETIAPLALERAEGPLTEATQGGWTRLFGKGDVVGEDVLSRVLSGLATIFEGASVEDTFKSARDALKKVFACHEISIFIHDPEVQPHMDEGSWVLTVKSGFGEGNRVSASDARSLEELKVGKPVPFNETLAQKAALKAIALAFQEDAFYGCDIEKKIVLLKDPTPADDLGSGDLSVLAIPLRFTHRVGRVEEKRKVGVLALFSTPCRNEMGDLEKAVRTMLGYALTTPSIALKDPVTTLHTEAAFTAELERQFSLFDLTSGKLRGGMVVGYVDALALYKQTLESEGAVNPNEVSQKVSEVYHGIGTVVWARCQNHALDESHVYSAGYPGRIGRDGFGIILPLLKDHEMVTYASRLSKDVVNHPFEGEQLLASGDITTSLRVIPFGAKSAKTAAECMKLAKATMDHLEAEQRRVRGDTAALLKTVNTVKILSEEGDWLDPAQWRSTRKF
jgi:GGDEF domain-containing protein